MNTGAANDLFTTPTLAASPAELEILKTLRRDVGELRSQLAQMRNDQTELLAEIRQTRDELLRLKQTLDE